MTQTLTLKPFENEVSLASVLATQYMKQIENYFSDHDRAMKFLSSVRAAVQRNPALLKCVPETVINSFMTMAQLGLMPSDVSGEAYVIPYNNTKKEGDKFVKQMEAQFQLGYQGLVTLFYRAGAKQIIAEIVYEKDKFTIQNGIINHMPDVFTERGKAKGAYVIVTLSSGGEVSKVMTKDEILVIAKKFSKSFSSDKSPWAESNDPQLWMWRKTVLKQIAKLVPKNESLVRAIAEDNKDSIIADRLNGAMEDAPLLTMGNLVKHDKNKTKPEEEENQDGVTDAEGPQAPGPADTEQR